MTNLFIFAEKKNEVSVSLCHEGPKSGTATNARHNWRRRRRRRRSSDEIRCCVVISIGRHFTTSPDYTRRIRWRPSPGRRCWRWWGSVLWPGYGEKINSRPSPSAESWQTPSTQSTNPSGKINKHLTDSRSKTKTRHLKVTRRAEIRKSYGMRDYRKRHEPERWCTLFWLQQSARAKVMEWCLYSIYSFFFLFLRLHVPL